MFFIADEPHLSRRISHWHWKKPKDLDKWPSYLHPFIWTKGLIFKRDLNYAQIDLTSPIDEIRKPVDSMTECIEHLGDCKNKKICNYCVIIMSEYSKIVFNF
jgi:hypothetical protein